MASFESILDTPATQIKNPEALPVGSYLCIVDGPGEFAKLGKNETDALKVNLKPIQAQADVDQERLSQVLDGGSLQDKKISTTFWITEESKHRVKNWCVDALGIEPENKSLRQLISEIQGKQVIAHVAHRPSADGQTIYADVKSFARV